MTCLCILVAMIFFPFQLLAEEKIEVVEHEAGFYYTVQKGDTLWDLSERFSDSPWLWPDLWNENRQIPNPHLIYPGERIRLYHKKGVETLVIETVEKKPPPVEPPKELPFYYYSPIDSTGFISETPVHPLGSIFKAKDDKTMIGAGDLVYIKPAAHAAVSFGNKYAVYRTFQPIQDKETNTLIGTQHYLTGIVEITKIEPNFALAKVIQSFRDIEANDLLMPYHKKSPKITLIKSSQGLKGKIIIAEEHGTLIGNDTVAFIDKGQKDNVKRGQSYNIYYQEKQPADLGGNKDAYLTPVVFGSLLVLHTQPTTATVLIVWAEKSISPGSKIRSPME